MRGRRERREGTAPGDSAAEGILPAPALRLAFLLLPALLLCACAEKTGGAAATSAGVAAPPASAPSPAPRNGIVGTEALPLAAAPPPIIHRGSGPVAAPAAAAAPTTAVTPGGDVTLNFTDADIREVVRAVVGNILGLDYVIDPKLQGTVTVQTGKPLPRAAVLPTIERVLRASGAALIQDDGLVRVTALDAGAKGAQPALGYGIDVLPLQYVSATELQKVLQPFLPTGAVLQVDDAHNILLLSGTREDMASLGALVRSFDIDWLSRTSFALVPLRAATPETIVSELTAIVAGTAGPDEKPNALRLVPVERLNAVLVIAAQPKYLDWARQQIERLDAGSEDGTEHTYIYHVQYGRASDLADVLRRVYGASGGGAAGAAPPPAESSQTSFLQSGMQGGGAMGAMGAGAPGFGGTAPTGGPGFGGPAPAGGGAGEAAPASGLASTAPLTNALSATPPAAAAPGANASAAGAPSEPGTEGTAPASAVRIVTDERNNALVIVTTPREYRRVDEALHRLDVKPLQVVIEATIAEITLNDELQFGLQWYFRSGSGNGTFTNVSTATPTQSFPGFSYILSDQNVQVVLNALSSITTVDVVSSPQLMVLNNQTAQLQVGQQVPVPVEQQQSVITAEAPLINTISYINTGVILSVTPRANANGEVTLDIEQEVSDVAATTSAGLNAPTLDERRIKSTVSVESGESVALGGLISKSVTKNRSAVPVLADIPVIGALFRNDDNTTTRTELLVLIEPRIINGADDARAATDDLRNRMHDIEPIE